MSKCLAFIDFGTLFLLIHYYSHNATLLVWVSVFFYAILFCSATIAIWLELGFLVSHFKFVTWDSQLCKATSFEISVQNVIDLWWQPATGSSGFWSRSMLITEAPLGNVKFTENFCQKPTAKETKVEVQKLQHEEVNIFVLSCGKNTEVVNKLWFCEILIGLKSLSKGMEAF